MAKVRNSGLYLLTLLLGLLVLRGFYSSLRQSVHQTPIRLHTAERFALAGEYCDILPAPVRRLFRYYALLKESDQSARKWLRGESLSADERSSLPTVYQRLAQSQAETIPSSRSELKALGYQSLYRILLCYFPIGLAILGSLSILWLNSGREESPEPVQEAEKEESKLLLILLPYLIWCSFQFYLVPQMARAEVFQSPALQTLSLWCLSYGLLAGLLWWNSRSIKWRPKLTPNWPVAAGSYLLSLVAVNAVEWIFQGVTGIDIDTRVARPDLLLWSAGFIALMSLMAVLVAPFFEELLFRSWLLGISRSKLGTAGAVALSTTLFTLGHGNVWAIPGLLAFSLILSWSYLKTRSLTTPFVVHALWNLTSLCLTFLAV